MNRIITFNDRKKFENPQHFHQKREINNNDYNQTDITNNIVKKVVNVYQIDYKNGKQSGGLGDFLRGCITLSVLCHKFNLDFGIDFNNHIIGNYIQSNQKNNNNPQTNETISYENVKLIALNNNYQQDLEQIIQHINQTNREICYLCTTINIEQNLSLLSIYKFNNSNIIKNLLPTSQITENINKIYAYYGIKSNEYGIIHIRGGDSFLVNKQFENDYMSSLISFISKKIKSHKINSKKYIIISDNAVLKNYIKSLHNNFIVINNNILPVHLAFGKMDNLNVMWTLTDFFLMAGSSEVISFSRYMHGSGFSKWGSFIFNKPFTQYTYTDINSSFNNIVSGINNFNRL